MYPLFKLVCFFALQASFERTRSGYRLLPIPLLPEILIQGLLNKLGEAFDTPLGGQPQQLGPLAVCQFDRRAHTNILMDMHVHVNG
jgi:hypothetical protein